MPLVRLKNETLVDKRESTYLTAAAVAAATTLTVVDNSNFLTDNDYLLVGVIGAEGSEIVQINGAGTVGTSITIDREGASGGLRFAHPINTPVYRLDYNQFRLAHSTSTATADIDNANITTAALQFDDAYTRYEETSFTTGYYFIRFYNATTASFSDYSAAIPVGGHDQRSLWEIGRRVYRELGFMKNDDMDESIIKFTEVRRAINDKQRDIIHERLWLFAENERSFSAVANQFRYVPSSSAVNRIFAISFDSKPCVPISKTEWDGLHIDSDSTSSYATHFIVWNNEIWFYPKPSAAASTTAINDAANMSATATSVTVDSNSGFRATGGFYRFIIDSEVIYATGTTATTFTGLLRAREGTTAAIHTDNTTITERDIVYSYQVEPTDLSDITDTTVIPEPEALAFGVAHEFALGVLQNNGLADRLKIKYDETLVKLRNKYSKKVISDFSYVKDTLELVYGIGYRNPNDYPRDLT